MPQYTGSVYPAGLLETQIQGQRLTSRLGCAVQADKCYMGVLHHRGRPAALPQL